MQAIRYVIPSLMEAGRFVPGMTRTFVPIARNAINAARSRLSPSWEYASRNEMREAARLADVRQSVSNAISNRRPFNVGSLAAGAGIWGAANVAQAAYFSRGKTSKKRGRDEAATVQDSGFEGFPVTSYIPPAGGSRARPPGSGIYPQENSGGGSHSGSRVRSVIKRKKRTSYD